MIELNKIVKVLRCEEEQIDKIHKELNISKLASRVLLNRGLKDIEKCKIFLEPDIKDFHDPFLLNDMDKASERIIEALENNENIWIYGDYDVDGITSTSILKIFFSDIEYEIDYYIPYRMSEGYGLNKEAIDHIKENGGNLIITVDCGITSFDVVDYCNSLGIDIIITDHHTCQENIPNAIAVINPNRKDSSYPFNKLAGVGVALKLVQALSIKLAKDINYNEILPIAAIGTVADVVSLTGENRIIVKSGLDIIHETNNLGIRALIETTGLKNKKISSGHIGFVIGPRINATGRIGFAKYGVELFISKDYNEALNISKKLDEENTKRQIIEKNILDEAEELIKREINLEKDKIIVLASENWHMGVIGIVSSRITEKYGKPSVLISIEGGEGRGSARSIPTFNIYEGLSGCEDLLLKFGGHSQAAGLSIEEENIKEFRKRINSIANDLLSDIDMIPEIIVDGELEKKEISIKTVNELKLLEPFGIENSTPIFLYKGVNIKYIRTVGKDSNHLKMTVEKDGLISECIGFNMGYYIENISINDVIDLVVNLDINDFQNKLSVQLNIKDIIIPYDIEDLNEEFYNKLECENPSNVHFDNQIKVDKIEILDKELRREKVIKYIKNENNTLIIVNNYINFIEIINDIRFEGRDLIKKTFISYLNLDNENNNSILLNPNVEDIDFRKYENIILYDLCFDKDYLHEIVVKSNEKLKILLTEEDLKFNRKIVKSLVPDISEIRTIYKSFVGKGEKLKIDIDKYIMNINARNEYNLNIRKLQNSLEILKQAILIDYKIDGGYLYVMMLEKPKNKIDIQALPKYKSVNEMLNKIYDVEKYFSQYYNA